MVRVSNPLDFLGVHDKFHHSMFLTFTSLIFYLSNLVSENYNRLWNLH